MQGGSTKNPILIPSKRMYMLDCVFAAIFESHRSTHRGQWLKKPKPSLRKRCPILFLINAGIKISRKSGPHHSSYVYGGGRIWTRFMYVCTLSRAHTIRIHRAGPSIHCRKMIWNRIKQDFWLLFRKFKLIAAKNFLYMYYKHIVQTNHQRPIETALSSKQDFWLVTYIAQLTYT